MASIIGHILPIAIGVALSSVPIIVMVLILLSPRGRWSSLAYLIGATVGLAGLTALFTAVASLLPPVPDSQQSPQVAVIEMMLGLALLVLAAVRWRRGRRRGRAGTDTGTADDGAALPADEVSPAPSSDGVAIVLEADDLETVAPPGWMTRVTSLGPIPSFGVGFVLMFRPKNLVLTIAAGVAIGAGGVSFTEVVVSIVIFVVLGISTLAAPIIFAFADPGRMRRPLEGTRIWIERNSSTVTTIVLLMLGTVIVGSGLAHF